MKLSISNIAWNAEQDTEMYLLMKENGFTGLEIAPTRWIEQQPYDYPEKAEQISDVLRKNCGLTISSMQSIWYGRTEMLFGNDEERIALSLHTKKAVNFAGKIGCRNLVFGCPRNRYIPDGMSDEVAVSFFKELGDYAYTHHTVLALEANPVIYNTNYINTTVEAIELIKRVNSPGFLLNLDFGTIIQNRESLKSLTGNETLIHHVHISEPKLCPIQKRYAHLELAALLRKMNYSGFVSIEMGKTEGLAPVIEVMQYVKEIFT